MYSKIVFFLQILSIFIISACSSPVSEQLPEEVTLHLSLKTPGNPAETHKLEALENDKTFSLKADKDLPLQVNYSLETIDENIILKLRIKAREDCNFNISGAFTPEGIAYNSSEFLMPGFWYHHNSRSPENAPNLKKGGSWLVREDRLSLPLSAVFDTLNKSAYLIMRNDIPRNDALMPFEYGEVILHGKTDLGGIGFGKNAENACLLFSYPFSEKPFTYRRKLWLAPETVAFQNLKAGEESEVSWIISGFEAATFSEFTEKSWSFAYSRLKPEEVPAKMSTDSVKRELAQYFRESYTECGNLASSSGVELRIDLCEKRGIFEIGFVGRVLMNAFNSLEYGYQQGDSSLIAIGNNIFKSYTQYGFTPEGLLREWIDCSKGEEADIFSLRRQSEGLMAIVHYLDFEKRNGRLHPELEQKSLLLFNRLVKLMREDNSFPRKFNARFEVTDPSGGSTPTVITPLIMASAYFNNPEYLTVAQQTAHFLDREIVSKADYFSSTLDANCEDKEASLYTLNAYYYLWLASENSLKTHYFTQAKTVSFFALSWYYLWDVPFAPGQMLGDLGFKTRGWGNVSVENNHVDVYVFEFTEVLKWLAAESGDSRYENMAKLISSSMNDQLLPRNEYLCGISTPGYHPEVVQHTHWDYGKNGKGYYNDIFAPGWVVSSLWELHTPGRTSRLIKTNLNTDLKSNSKPSTKTE